MRRKIKLAGIFACAMALGLMMTAAAQAAEPQAVCTRIYRDFVSEPSIPETIEFTAGGQAFAGSRSKTEKSVSTAYEVPFSITGRFYGDEDSLYYEFAGQLIPAAQALDFERYQTELLSYLGLDPELYRLENASWSTDYYRQEGQTVREAVFTGRQRSTTYRVTYEAD